MWEAERGVVETAEKTLAIPVMLDGSLEGYIYDGHSKLVLDTVIETKQGAIGRPVEKEINQPFLMLGNIQKAQQRLSATDQKDLSEMGYANQEEFISNAEDLLNKFFRGARTNECRHSIDGLVFAFQNETNKLDILIATGTKLVYKTTNTVFLSNRGKVVLKNPSRVVCVSNGKSILVER